MVLEYILGFITVGFIFWGLYQEMFCGVEYRTKGFTKEEVVEMENTLLKGR